MALLKTALWRTYINPNIPKKSTENGEIPIEIRGVDLFFYCKLHQFWTSTSQ